MQVMEGAVDKIAKRDLERKLDLQKRKEDRNNLTAKNEKLEYFKETFLNKHINIENLLGASTTMDADKLADHFNEISKEILLLQKYVAASNIFLRTYDIKKCHEVVQDLTNKAKGLEEDLLPKRKFGFKNKLKPKVDNKSKDEVDLQSKSVVVTQQLCGFSDEKDVDLVMEGDAIYRKDVTAENLENCKVKFLGCPSTLHLNNLRNCYVLTGPVSTSIFAENCINCTLVIACQQLRLHASKDVNIYLHVTSRAIMEDCSDISIAPYNLTYKNIAKDFTESGLDKSTNNWKCVDDFNWLHLEKQSPNWSLLSEQNLVNNWDNVM